jgi:thiol-disulfide isomerase/thioredoxin
MSSNLLQNVASETATLAANSGAATLAANVASSAANTASKLPDAASDVAKAIQASKAAAVAANVASSAANTVANVASSAANTVANVASSAANTAVDTASKLPDAIAQTAKAVDEVKISDIRGYMQNTRFLNIPLWGWLVIVIVVTVVIIMEQNNKLQPLLYEKTLDISGWIWILTILVIILLINKQLTQEPKSEKFSNNDVTIYNFNTTWCGWSKRFQPTWDNFSESVKQNMPNIKAIDIKCDDKKNEELCKQFKVPGYPSVVAVVNGETKMYSGSRTLDDLLQFAKSL